MLSRLNQPDSQDLKALRDPLEQLPLIGPDGKAWDDETDLISISQLDSRDPFSKLAFHAIVPFWHKMIGRHFRVSLLLLVNQNCVIKSDLLHKKPVTEAPATGICHYSNSRLRGLIDIIGTLISSLLLISSIITLYFISNPLDRLWLIAGFTAFFSLCLALITDARRVEIFAASSA